MPNTAINTSTEPVSPVGLPNHHLFRNPKTGKIWEVGQELDCLSYELGITTGDAEALLAAGRGTDVRSILTILGAKEMWRKITGARDRAAYMRGVIRSESTKSKPTPSSSPLPPEKQAPPATQEQADTRVRDAIRALGDERYTVEEIGAQLAKKIGSYNRSKLEVHLASMIRRDLVQSALGFDGITYFGSLERSEPAGEFTFSM